MMLNIRLRPGSTGEAARVVHAGTGMTDGTLVTLCGQVFDPVQVEEARGMPCTGCVLVAVRMTAGPEKRYTGESIGLPVGEQDRRGDLSPRPGRYH